MQVVILCGGRGTRAYPFAESIREPMPGVFDSLDRALPPRAAAVVDR
jgi:dTDP-glucose pyrophosphorylase